MLALYVPLSRLLHLIAPRKLSKSMRRAAAAAAQQLENSHRLIADQRPRPPRDAEDVAEGHEHGEQREPQTEAVAEQPDQGGHDRAPENARAQNAGDRAV